jgi:hypothetical protein
MYKPLLALALVGGLASCDHGGIAPGSRDDAAAQGDDAMGTARGTGGATFTLGLGGSSGVGGQPGFGGRGFGGVSGQGGALGRGGGTGVNGTGGRFGAGGGMGTGGRAGTGGATGRGGASGTGGSALTTLDCNTALPTPTSKVTVDATVAISGTKDYAMQQVCANPSTLGAGDQSENQKAVFMLAANAVLKNVIIGGAGCSAADGVHCESGSCTLENVWFGDVGEDAISFKGSNPSQVMTITGGGAFSASDKVIQHNGPGTIKVSSFYVNTAGKLYRSCGNCSSQYARHVVLDHITAKGVKTLVGVNANYGDAATLTNITLCGGSTTICQRYNGNNTGAEPTSIGSGPDGTNCIYSNSDITTQ